KLPKQVDMQGEKRLDRDISAFLATSPCQRTTDIGPFNGKCFTSGDLGPCSPTFTISAASRTTRSSDVIVTLTEIAAIFPRHAGAES
ncbi:MAG: hypothetical protein AAGG44_12070, partial [Planctomycetota bacterium]